MASLGSSLFAEALERTRQKFGADAARDPELVAESMDEIFTEIACEFGIELEGEKPHQP